MAKQVLDRGFDSTIARRRRNSGAREIKGVQYSCAFFNE